jgi:hypothetical protein
MPNECHPPRRTNSKLTLVRLRRIDILISLGFWILECGLWNLVLGEKSYPQGGPSVYKTFGRSYDRIYRRSGLRPGGLRSYVGANLCVRPLEIII